MFDCWGRVWADQLKENRPERLTMGTIDMWTVSLVQAGMTQTEFDRAIPLSISATLEWPISSPSAFLALVRGEHTSQFPETYTAYAQAANGVYLHTVCYETAVRVGLLRLRSEDARYVYPSWKEAYQVVCNESLAGATHIQPVSHQIENKSQPTPASVAISSDYINKISLLLAGE